MIIGQKKTASNDGDGGACMLNISLLWLCLWSVYVHNLNPWFVISVKYDGGGNRISELRGDLGPLLKLPNNCIVFLGWVERTKIKRMSSQIRYEAMTRHVGDV